MKFILSAAAGAVGVLVTLVFIPEITSLDLKEGDTRWDLMKKGMLLIYPLSVPVCHIALAVPPRQPCDIPYFCGDWDCWQRLEGSKVQALQLIQLRLRNLPKGCRPAISCERWGGIYAEI